MNPPRFQEDDEVYTVEGVRGEIKSEGTLNDDGEYEYDVEWDDEPGKIDTQPESFFQEDGVQFDGQ